MLRADCGKIVIAVSDDIDPTNADCAIFYEEVARLPRNLGEDLQINTPIARAATARSRAAAAGATPP